MGLAWNLYNYILLLSLVIGVIPFFSFQENKKEHRVLFSVIFLGLVTEAIGLYYGSRGIYNSWIYNISFLYLETIVIWFYFLAVFRKGHYQKIFIVGIVLFSVWFVFNSFFLQGFWEVFQTYTVIISSLSIILCCLWFFYLLVAKNWLSEKSLVWFPAFWVVCFLFFFYAASFLYFTSLGYLISLDWHLNYILNSILKTLSGLMYMVMGFAYLLPYLQKKFFLAPEKY
ncbi:hypothetical protein CLV48_11569 [Cecembia rubra]|uniref:Bacteriorhodopsin-like protein n=1 Tax=Cecembia rubra TaxID=1485585 RepID=A0A2P8DTH1_9BACT|nr:hypothetical protein CLV48_11569 [Cecembia rubra]